MTPNVRVERYDPNRDTGLETLDLVCGSFEVDQGVLVIFSGTGNQRPNMLFADGEWRSVQWL